MRRQLGRRPAEELLHERGHWPSQAHVDASLLHQHRGDWCGCPYAARLKRIPAETLIDVMCTSGQRAVAALELACGCTPIHNSKQFNAKADAPEQKHAASTNAIALRRLPRLLEAHAAEAAATTMS